MNTEENELSEEQLGFMYIIDNEEYRGNLKTISKLYEVFEEMVMYRTLYEEENKEVE